MNDSTVQKFKEFGTRFGFRVLHNRSCYHLCAKNTDGHWTVWLKYDPTQKSISLRGHTDHLNLWLHETRPDLTPERCLQFVRELNEVFALSAHDSFSLRDLIDPEDWQEIAGISDAYADPRYAGKLAPALAATIADAEGKTVPALKGNIVPEPGL